MLYVCFYMCICVHLHVEKLSVHFTCSGYKLFQHFGCACALGRVNRYPESCH